MFGYIVSGQVPNASFERVAETQFLANLTIHAESVHIVVFITEPFPEGYGGAIYFNWPNPEPTWQYLGYITNSKASAIFRASQLKGSGTAGQGSMFGVTSGGTHPQLGISVLPLQEIEQLVVTNDNTAQTVASNVQFVQKMLDNLYNYVSSFAVTQQQMQPCGDQWVKTSTLNQWYERFKSKMSNDPNFWKK